MGNLSLGFGKKKSSASQQSRPYFTDTGYSSISGTSIRLDPSIRRIQDRAMGDYASIYGDVGNATDRFLTQSSDLRGRYGGNAGAFMTARTNPVTERFSNLRGQVQQNLGRRNLSGSSFQTQSLRDIDTIAAREEGDARALATQELAGFEASLNAQELTALNQKAAIRAQITGESLEVAKARLLQELSAFGLGQNVTGSSTTRDFGLGASFKL